MCNITVKGNIREAGEYFIGRDVFCYKPVLVFIIHFRRAFFLFLEKRYG